MQQVDFCACWLGALQDGDLGTWCKRQGRTHLPEDVIMMKFVQICLGMLHVHSKARAPNPGLVLPLPCTLPLPRNDHLDFTGSAALTTASVLMA